MIRQTSLMAYKELKDIGERQRIVFNAFRKYGDATDLEITKYLSYGDPNKVRPRRNELVKAGFLSQKGKKICLVSGKMAIYWGIK